LNLQFKLQSKKIKKNYNIIMEYHKRMEIILTEGREPPIPSYVDKKIIKELTEKYTIKPDMAKKLQELGKTGNNACEKAGLIYWGPVADLAPGAEESIEQGYTIPYEPAGDIHWCPFSNITKYGGWQLSDGEKLWDIPLEWFLKK